MTTASPAVRAMTGHTHQSAGGPHRRAALITGVLLILAIAGALASSAAERPLLTATVSLARIPAGGSRLPAGGLTELLTALASTGIAVALYPVLRRHSPGLAIGSVAFRTIEGALYAVAGIITLSLPGLARQYAQSPAPGHSAIQAAASALAQVRADATLAGVVAYVGGASLYYCALYRSRLVPRWLAGWGVAAQAPMLAACVAAAVGNHPVTSYTPLVLPILANELALAAWLIARGFSPVAAPAPRPGG